jgi:hypothetical protein
MGVGKRIFYRMVYAYIGTVFDQTRAQSYNSQAKVRSTFKSDWTKISVCLYMFRRTLTRKSRRLG